jgi:hypothetical protein
MADGAYKEIKEKLNVIIATQVKHGEGLVRIDEHLKTLNGAVQRHEACIRDMDTDNDTQWATLNKHMQESAEFRGMVNAKLALVGICGGGVATIAAWALGAI